MTDLPEAKDTAPGQHISAVLVECINANRRVLASSQTAYDNSRANYRSAMKLMAEAELRIADATQAIHELQTALNYYRQTPEGLAPPVTADPDTVEEDISKITVSNQTKQE